MRFSIPIAARQKANLMFTNTRFTVNSSVTLSMSHWTRKDGVEIYAVALFYGKQLQHDTAMEFAGDDGFTATDYAFNLVTKELGYAPERFFRDNVIVKTPSV